MIKRLSNKLLTWLVPMIFILNTLPSASLVAEVRVPVLIIDGANNHDWQRGTALLKGILQDSGLFQVDVSTVPDEKQKPDKFRRWHPDFSKYRAIISNYNNGYDSHSGYWSPEVQADFENYVRGGGGFVSVHAANNAFADWPAYNEMIGLGWRGKNFGSTMIVTTDEKIQILAPGEGHGPGHPPEHDFVMTVLDEHHPITEGMPKRWFHPHEQLSHGQRGPAKNLHVLTYAWADDTKENEVMDWVVSYGLGRVYVTMLGHLWKNGAETAYQCVGFQTLFVRGVEWAAKGTVTYSIPSNFPTETQASLRPLGK